MNILTGLIIPEKGKLQIDGIDYKDLDLYSLRNNIGFISQESPTFSDTIFNNITFWDEPSELNKKRFLFAIKKASIFDYIMQLPDRENTFIGNNGINLSGGQKQRIAIARELYKKVDLLFMDEATSALDGETEASIQKNIEELHGEYTIVMIAHRLSTIKNADRIILLKNGQISASGSFNELMQSSPEFQNMINLQEF